MYYFTQTGLHGPFICLNAAMMTDLRWALFQAEHTTTEFLIQRDGYAVCHNLGAGTSFGHARLRNWFSRTTALRGGRIIERSLLNWPVWTLEGMRLFASRTVVLSRLGF